MLSPLQVISGVEQRQRAAYHRRQAHRNDDKGGEKTVKRGLKRLLDVAVSLVALTLLSVPLALIALAIKLDSKGPVFFLQQRVGLNGKHFDVWKFRTMVVGAVHRGLGYNVKRDDERITRIGHRLRNWGVDELPQLINVLLGSMSLVGPRPTLAYQVDRYNAFQRKRLRCKPGITSLAVVNGRNRLSWARRIEYDVWYVEHWSLWLDLKILFKTLWVVLVTREGIYGDEGVNDDFSASEGQES